MSHVPPWRRELVEGLLAAVGGIMAFLTFHELLPLAMQHAGKGASVAAVFVGMALMSGKSREPSILHPMALMSGMSREPSTLHPMALMSGKSP